MQIDLDKIIKQKSKWLYTLLPKFVLNWLKKVIHQEEINEVMTDLKNLQGAAFAEGVLLKMGVKIKSTGLENIPKKGGLIVAANHPLGGVDGMALLVEISKVRPDVKAIVNDILLNIPNLQSVFLGVNKLGGSSRTQLLEIEKLYQSGQCIMVFPAGFCSRLINGKIQDVEWNTSFIKKSMKYHLPITPAYIKGRNTKRFYGINLWRRRLGVKFNLELLTLPDEMFKQKGKNLDINFYKTVEPQELSQFTGINEKSLHIRNIVYNTKSIN